MIYGTVDQTWTEHARGSCICLVAQGTFLAYMLSNRYKRHLWAPHTGCWEPLWALGYGLATHHTKNSAVARPNVDWPCPFRSGSRSRTRSSRHALSGRNLPQFSYDYYYCHPAMPGPWSYQSTQAWHEQSTTMAAPAVDIIYSVFLPGRMVLSQSAVDYQLAHAGEFNCEGLNTYTIALMSVVTVAVALRLWSRKIAGIDWRSDDYTLVAGWVRLYFPRKASH